MENVADASTSSNDWNLHTNSNQVQRGGNNCNQLEIFDKGSKWYNLPKDIWEEILPQLTLCDLFRALTVCKSWNSILFSQCCCQHVSMINNNFCNLSHDVVGSTHKVDSRKLLETPTSMYGSFAKPKVILPLIHLGSPNMWGSYFPVFIQRHGQQFCVGYQSSSSSWEKLPQLSFLPPSIRGRGYSPFGAGGFICFAREVFQGAQWYTEIIVCNPVSKYWKLLPRLCAKHVCFHCMIHTKNEEKIFQIVGVGPRKWRDMYIYSSDVNSWSTSRISFPGGRYSEESEIQSSAVCNGMLFCVVENLKALAYVDIKKGAWNEIFINRFLKGYRSLWKVVECENQLYLVVVDRRGQSTHILKLDVMLMDWIRITSFPEDILGVYPPGRCDYIHPSKCRCVANGNKLIFALQYDYGKRWHCVVYDIAQGLWQKLPQCPFWMKQDIVCEQSNVRHTEVVDFQVVSSVYTPSICASLGCT